MPATEKVEVQTSLMGYKYDSAFALLLKQLVHPGLRGFVLAALLGAVVSSLAAMLNASSTIFTMDLYREYMNPRASQANLVAVGRLCVVLFTAIGCWIAPQLGKPEFQGIFTYIQEFQGFISPGVLAVFIFGLFVHKAPRRLRHCRTLDLSGRLRHLESRNARHGVLESHGRHVCAALAALTLMTLLMPLKEPVTLPKHETLDLQGSSGAKFWGVAVVIATLVLYGIFF